MKKKAKVGRPPVKDGSRSYTVSLRLSEKKVLVLRYGSLTKAIKSLLKPTDHEKV